jgi:iron complex transport system ATP-binding protein
MRRERAVLRDVDFRVRSGEFVAVVGPNGAGKTTLLRVALGLVEPSSGRVAVDGRAPTELGGRERAARLGWLPQQLAPSEPLTAVELVMAARYRFDEPRGRSRQAALAALARLGAEDLAGARTDRISGGELWRQGLGVVCVTHDVNLLAHAGGAGTLRVFGMRQGAARFEHCFADDALAAELGELFGVPVTRVHAGTRPLFVPLIDVPEQAP